MPVRPATRRDIPIMAQVVAASFGPDGLFRTFFPHQEEYWGDYERAIRENLWLSWYDYKKVLMVSYSSDDDAENIDEETGLLTATTSTAKNERKKGRIEKITGVAEWQREGRGWQRVHGSWLGAWDPRRLMKPLLAFYYTLRRRLVGNRAAGTTDNSSNPPRLTLWNFEEQIGRFMKPFFAEPHRQTRWLLNTLAIHPDEQGKGYGKELVLDGLENLVDQDAEGKLPAAVVAAEGKETFYQKLGFKELVGWASKAEAEDGSENPLKRYGVGGGAVLWTW